jgi:hypothetical protein
MNYSELEPLHAAMFTTIVNNNVVLAALPIGGSVAAPVS